MRIFRRGFLVVFAAVFIITAGCFIHNWGKQAAQPPHFEKNTENITVSLEHYREELLNSVKAFDSNGNDISESVVLKKLVKADGKDNFHVTYAVFDSEGVSAEYTASAQILGYVSPRIDLKDPLRFAPGGSGYLADWIKVTDVFDGDISAGAKIVSADMDYDSPGIYTILVQVENSVGDITTFPLKIVVRPQSGSGYTMTLTNNVVYAKKGQKVDPQAYIKDFHRYDSTTQNNIQIPSADVGIVYSGDPLTDDIYHIIYMIPEGSAAGWPTDDSGRREVFFDITGQYDYSSFSSQYSSDAISNLKFKTAVVLTVIAEDS